MKLTTKAEGLVHKSALYLKRACPSILACLSTAGVVATSIMAVKATPKAVDLIKAKSRKEHDGDPYAYTKLEAIQSCWTCYIPAALVGLSTITCIFGTNVLNKRKHTSLISAYGILNESYKRYREAAKSIYGDDADAKIKYEAAKEVYIHADGYSLYNQRTNSEEVLFYDSFSRRYFTSTMPAVLNAQYHMNRNFCLRGEIDLNEYYDFLGINKIDGGESIGWSFDESIEAGFMWIDFDNDFVTLDDGLECCVITSLFEPGIL